MCFSSGVYLYFRILMYVKRHEQFEIGCGAILNKIYYFYYSRFATRSEGLMSELQNICISGTKPSIVILQLPRRNIVDCSIFL